MKWNMAYPFEGTHIRTSHDMKNCTRRSLPVCGVSGFLDISRQTNSDDLKATVIRMADALHHRGPDDGGAWVDPEAGIALGHRRLSILDLSPQGHQPMHSACGRYVVAFNGEIYNFKFLRQELENLGCRFRGHSDTEVLLASISQWGLEKAVLRFNGMFAFALWDRLERQLHLVRDRLGEKPLYYGWMGKIFLFGSELKALRVHPVFKSEIHRDALALYMRHNYIPSPYSIYSGIYKLPPGTILTIPSMNAASTTPVPYWSARAVAERGVATPWAGSDEEAFEELDRLLRNAIKLRMVADVPLGAFLSGGIDSSVVVALMQAQSDRKVKTFSLGFNEVNYDEAIHAKKVAHHLGTDHTEWYITPAEAMAVIPKLPELYDEPFSDSSQIPTYLVSALARRSVTVSLSGDGGDELFGGYNRYFWGRNIWKGIGWIPPFLRSTLANVLTAPSPQIWDKAFRIFGSLLPSKIKQRMAGDRIHKLAEILALDSPEAMYYNLISHWKDANSVILGASTLPTILTKSDHWASLSDFTLRMMYLDTVTYLPDDILVKVDRASMAVGLEGRIPLLDHELLEFAWRLPLSMKVRNGKGKRILRHVLFKYVPPDLIERPKMGFGIPIDNWLRGPLRGWAEELLNESRLKREGYFRPVPIVKKWNEHLSGKRNWQYHLWDVLMFQSWLEKQI